MRDQHNWYVRQIAIYKHFDGLDGKQGWRKEIVECLTGWAKHFPSVRKNERKSALNLSPAVNDEVAQVIRTLPAGYL